MARYISMDHTGLSARFHCPACGAEICSEGGEFTNQPCPHLLFSFISEIGEFQNTHPSIRAIVNDPDMEAGFSDAEFLNRCPNGSILFALEYSGIACGPIGFTVIHAVQFPGAEEPAEDMAN